MQPINPALISQIIVIGTVLYTLFSYWQKDLLWWYERNKIFIFKNRFEKVIITCTGCGHTKEHREDPIFLLIFPPLLFAFMGEGIAGDVGAYILGILGVILSHRLVFKEQETCKLKNHQEEGD